MTIQSPGKDSYNYTRSFRMFEWGVVGSVTMLLPWYRYLDVAGRSLSMGKWRTVAFKVGFDQLLFMPLYINVYFAFTGLLEGRSLREIEVRLKEKLLPSWMTSLMFWGTWQTANFRFIPATMQPIVVYCGSVIWNTLLSILSHAQQYGTEAEREAEDKVAQLEAALVAAEASYHSQIALLEEQVKSLQHRLDDVMLQVREPHTEPGKRLT